VCSGWADNRQVSWLSTYAAEVATRCWKVAEALSRRFPGRFYQVDGVSGDLVDTFPDAVDFGGRSCKLEWHTCTIGIRTKVRPYHVCSRVALHRDKLGLRQRRPDGDRSRVFWRTWNLAILELAFQQAKGRVVMCEALRECVLSDVQPPQGIC